MNASYRWIILILLEAFCFSTQGDVIWSGTRDIPLWWTGSHEVLTNPPPPIGAWRLDLNEDEVDDFILGTIDGSGNLLASCYGDNKLTGYDVGGYQGRGSSPLPEGTQIDASLGWG